MRSKGATVHVMKKPARKLEQNAVFGELRDPVINKKNKIHQKTYIPLEFFGKI